MPAKALIEVDVRIAALQDLTARGKGSAADFAELQKLLKRRGVLIEEMVAESAGERRARQRDGDSV